MIIRNIGKLQIFQENTIIDNKLEIKKMLMFSIAMRKFEG